MTSHRNSSIVVAELQQMDSELSEFIEVNDKLNQLLEHDDAMKLQAENDRLEVDAFKVKTTATRWLSKKSSRSSHSSSEGRSASTSSGSRRKSSSKSSKSSSHGSRHSSSSRSSRKSQTLMEKIATEEARLTELKLEVSFKEEKTKIRAQLERIELEEEMMKSAAKVETYNRLLAIQCGDSESDASAEERSEYKFSNLRQDAPEFKPAELTSRQSPMNLPSNLPTQDVTSRRSGSPTNPEISHQDSNPVTTTSAPLLSSNLRQLPANSSQVRKRPPPSSSSDSVGDQNPAGLHRKEQPASSQLQLEPTLDVLCQLLQQQGAPEADLEVFEGNPLEFKFFMRSFEEVVEKKIKDPRGRLARLMKFTKGEAKELIKGCIHKEPKDGYFFAKQLLEKRFGDPNRILAEYRRQLRSWKPLKPGDGPAYRSFYCFLLKCSSLADTVIWNALDSSDNLRVILSKLPGMTRERWNRKVMISRTKHREPDLRDLIEFVDQETLLVNDPLYSKDAFNDFFSSTQSGAQSQQKSLVKNFNVIAKQKGCDYCGKGHHLDACTSFDKNDMNDKVKFVMKNRLCFGCLGTSHISKDCKQRRKCRKCEQNHPTCMHGHTPKAKKREEEEDTQNSAVCNATKWNAANAISVCVVPVVLKEPGGRELLTHALLDSCSQGSFVCDDVLTEMKIEGIPTQITIKTLNGEETSKSTLVKGLSVKGICDGDSWLNLPNVFSRPFISSSDEDLATYSKVKRWQYLHRLKDKLCAEDDVKIGLLIGANCPAGLEPREVIESRDGGPFAFRTKLGWCVVGPIQEKSSTNMSCNKVQMEPAQSRLSMLSNDVKDVGIEKMWQKMNKDEILCNQLGLLEDYNLEEISQDDMLFLEILERETKKVDGHYEIPLPFRKKDVTLPNNKWVAVKRAESLKRKLMKDSSWHADYTEFMNKMIMKNYARLSVAEAHPGKTWFIPHHGVIHPTKNKIRVVFDCSSEVRGESLNKHLLQGPDLTNQLIGVLIRFREEKVAFSADIEAMFYQVRIPEEQKGFVRFLWWPNGDWNEPLEEYEMNVHVFGGTSSPGCSNYALRRAARDGEAEFGHMARKTLEENFYVDDLLKSMPDVPTSIALIKSVIGICGSGGFNLTKFISNHEEVLKALDESDRKEGVKDRDLCSEKMPIDYALGVKWDLDKDTFGFRMKEKFQPSTRRGILSYISSFYDPLGFAAPFVLKGKQILQGLCCDEFGWDDPIPDYVVDEWECWKSSLKHLEEVKIPRCFKTPAFGKVTEASLHHFSDACDYGYAMCSYLRLVDENGKVNCSLIIGKARVISLKKRQSTPRQELQAAVLSASVGSRIRKEIRCNIDYELFWTDSQVVLGYVNNESKRFKVFVANRIRHIVTLTNVSDWKYVPSDENPADEGCRGLDAKKLRNSMWFTGPEFLWKREISFVEQTYVVNEDDPELKVVQKAYVSTVVERPWYDRLTDKISSFSKLKRIVAYVIMFVTSLKRLAKEQRLSRYRLKLRSYDVTLHELNVTQTQEAQLLLLKVTQENHFADEMKMLNNGMAIKSSSQLCSLNPFIGKDGLLRVGGRLRRSAEEFEMKHPIIIPKKTTLTTLILRHCHNNVHHQGRGLTINEVRQNGFWVINVNSAVRKLIWSCVLCKLLRGKFLTQLMSDLPPDRMAVAAPFTFVGVDLFGPFLIKERRSEVKRYGVIFTCLSCRGVHIESTNTMDTDSFILALRRFIARRGNVRLIRSDNGSNFVGAQKELKISSLDNKRIGDFLRSQDADWVVWERNPPYASNFGGVWERQIRSARRILEGLLLTHSKSLHDESFRTLLCETEAIINSRPLTVESLSDATSLTPLSPSTLLTKKSKVVSPPQGSFASADIYSRKYWRRVQHIVNEFWVRWRKEFLQQLQQRSKWQSSTRSLSVGDVVLVKADAARNEWPLGRVCEIFPDEDGNVRKVEIRLANRDIVLRPISKVVLLLKNDSPPRS